MNDFIDYYNLLGIKKDATEEEIKRAYRNQAKKWHPDVNDSKDALEIIKELNEAKAVLLDEKKKQEYDSYLQHAVNPSYEKIKNNTKQSYQDENTYQTNAKEYQHDYTKWEYFRDYLKYYDATKLRKTVAIIFVLIETVLCGLLQFINLLLAIILSFLSNAISYLASLIIGIVIIAIVISFLMKNDYIFPGNGIIGSIIVFVLCTLAIFAPRLIAILLFEKIPIALSKINICLFKLAVGYKEQ